MEWIETNKKHFVDIKYINETKYEWVENNNCPNKPFLVAVETNKGWDIDYVLLTENGLECYNDGDLSPYDAWCITDVTHWCEIEDPKQ